MVTRVARINLPRSFASGRGAWADVTAFHMTFESDRGRSGYHHGNVREAMIEVALRLIHERGPGGFSFAEVAVSKRRDHALLCWFCHHVYGLGPGQSGESKKSNKSLFASFSSEKEDSYFCLSFTRLP